MNIVKDNAKWLFDFKNGASRGFLALGLTGKNSLSLRRNMDYPSLDLAVSGVRSVENIISTS
jgi:hypothetical protein